ncbi:MAG: hypothetical protein IPK17_34235 [Chloroflexi bacterium]|uniref:hypothetical protein n=1 Tax=Candidatus Flexifilum breve TaxID=3140694 RepID=UPI003134C6D8|nr:hypothetical protein [Chloroflexota bacterium]
MNDYERESLLAEMLSSGQRRRQLIRNLNTMLPTGRNRWFQSQTNAHRAAQTTARRLTQRTGRPFAVRHHVYQPLRLRHYHLATPDGRPVRLRFFYGVIETLLEAEMDSELGGLVSALASGAKVASAIGKGARVLGTVGKGARVLGTVGRGVRTASTVARGARAAAQVGRGVRAASTVARGARTAARVGRGVKTASRVGRGLGSVGKMGRSLSGVRRAASTARTVGKVNRPIKIVRGPGGLPVIRSAGTGVKILKSPRFAPSRYGGRQITPTDVPRSRPKGYRRPAKAARQLATGQKQRVADSAWKDFLRKRRAYVKRLRARKGEDIHHAIERQVLTRYPGVFNQREINDFGNMRGIPTENAGLKQLHNRSIRDQWDYHYRKLDATIVENGLEPGTPEYNQFVRDYLSAARDEIDYTIGQFFTEQRRAGDD